MRVTFVAPYAGFSGGIRVIAAHARGLVERGHDVTVVSQPMPRLNIRQKIAGVFGRKELPGWMRSRGGHLDGSPVRHLVLERPGPVTDADVPDADAVVATWWETAEWVNRLSPSKGKKFYFIQGDEVDFYEHQDLRDRVLATWRMPMHKITVATWLVELGRRRSIGHDLSLVPNAVDTGVFQSRPRGKQSIPTVGMVFQNIRLKGADIMVEAFNLARRKIPSLRLIAFGDAPERDGPAWPSDMPLEVRPEQSRIPELYSSCDMWLFGTRREGFGLPILEAMACRTPVIGTPAGAAVELLSPGGGIVVRPENPVDMSEAICAVAEMSDQQWRRMSDIAFETAQRYSWARATEVLESVLVEGVRSGCVSSVGGGP
ncbi:MAG: glycosyltransferase family 4 protein [Phycisphaeraceae bacterium]|nr:glycosyltransferase family 4 protein [Phycisphaeraceae bacterium]